MLYALAGLGVGAAAGLVVSPYRGAVLAGLAGGLVAAVGGSGPSRVAVRLAAFAALVSVVFIVVAFASAGHRWWAALSMAVVAVLTSVGAGTGPAGAAVGAVCSLGYVLAVVLTTTASLIPGVSLASGALRVVLGALAGLAVTAAGAAVRDRRDRASARAAPRIPAPWPLMWTSLHTFDEHARDGVRRAIPLGVAMFLYQRSPTHDALWIFLAAFVVLLPTGKSPVSVAVARVVTTIVGVVVLSLLALVVPHSVLFSLAVVFLLLGMAYKPVYPLAAGGASAMGAILLVGAPSGAIATWAGHRLIDTTLGCALALTSMYVLWPHDKPTEDLPPATGAAVS